MMKLTTCPTCGSKKIRRVRRSVRGKTRGHPYCATAVAFYECPDCGEKVYDREAMEKIEVARSRTGLSLTRE
jgi:YgiT-type zinc finger domain-containing protein